VSQLRNVFLLLLLVNLAVLGWFRWVIERPDPGSTYEGPSITLLREVDRNELEATLLAARDVASSSAAGALVPGLNDSIGVEVDITEFERDLTLADGEKIDDGVQEVAVGRCTSIGPYLEAAAADSATATLIASGFEPSRRVRQAQVWQGFHLYIDGAESESAASEIASKLRENGVDATPVIADSGSRTLISLGVFSDMASATAEADRIGELGYEATIADSMTTAETFWLDVTLTAEESVSLDLLQAPGQIRRLEQLPCLATEAD